LHCQGLQEKIRGKRQEKRVEGDRGMERESEIKKEKEGEGGKLTYGIGSSKAKTQGTQRIGIDRDEYLPLWCQNCTWWKHFHSLIIKKQRKIRIRREWGEKGGER
jgi:hypothetical protein